MEAVLNYFMSLHYETFVYNSSVLPKVWVMNHQPQWVMDLLVCLWNCLAPNRSHFGRPITFWSFQGLILMRQSNLLASLGLRSLCKALPVFRSHFHVLKANQKWCTEPSESHSEDWKVHCGLLCKQERPPVPPGTSNPEIRVKIWHLLQHSPNQA